MKNHSKTKLLFIELPWVAATRAVLIACASLSCMSVMAVEDATLTLTGDLDSFLVGQAGYCGERAYVPQEQWSKIVLKGDEQVWFHTQSIFHTGAGKRTCKRERTFIPKAGTAYILRLAHLPGDCRVELFRVVPNADPVREKMIQPASQSCLAKLHFS
jgi:hypothetical protein